MRTRRVDEEILRTTVTEDPASVRNQLKELQDQWPGYACLPDDRNSAGGVTAQRAGHAPRNRNSG